MSVDWASLGAMAAITMAGCATVGWLLVRQLDRAARAREQNLEHQLNALDDAVRALETRLTELHASAAHTAEADAEPTAEAAEDSYQAGEAVAPEIQAAIAAAAVAVAGPGASVRSVRPLQAQPRVSAWSQQGRVTVQSSHNMRPDRGRAAPEREA